MKYKYITIEGMEKTIKGEIKSIFVYSNGTCVILIETKKGTYTIKDVKTLLPFNLERSGDLAEG